MSNIVLRDDCIEIKGQGYIGGKLYDRDTNSEIKRGRVIFDADSRNFHLLPDNANTGKEVSDEVTDKIKEIMEICKQDEKCKVISSCKELYDNVLDEEINTVRLYANVRGGTIRFDGRNEEEAGMRLFRFITAIYKGKKYELNFMRFFLENELNEEKPNEDRLKVNCILRSLQFDRVDNCKGVINQNGICYPDTSNGMDISSLPEEGNVCYNPKAEFSDSPEDIVKEFYDFIRLN